MSILHKARAIEQLYKAFSLLAPIFLTKKFNDDLCISLPDNMLLDDIAILVPHPDDEIIGCFHFIEKIGPATPIDLIYVTEESSVKIASLRRGESIKASRELTLQQQIWWSFPDGNLYKHRDDLKNQLSMIKNKYKLILCPAPSDRTPDHGVLAEEAYREISPEKLLWYRSTWWTFPIYAADVVIIGQAQKKQAALRCFISQNKLALQNTISASAFEARRLGCKYNSIECFRFASSGLVNINPLNVLSLKALWRLPRWL